MEYHEFLNTKKLIDLPTGLKETPKLSKMLYPFQEKITQWALKRGRAAIFADCGLGKGQPENVKILTPTGWTTYGKINIGDKIFNRGGNEYIVIGVYPKNEIDTYRIYYSDKTSQIFDIDHIHICRTANDRSRNKPWKKLSTKQLIKCTNLRYGKNDKSRNYDIPIIQPIKFKKKSLNISPYIIGVLLGDGYIKGQISFSTVDDDILKRVNKELPEGIYVKKKIGNNCDYNIKTGYTGNKRHWFRQELINLGLYGLRSNNKFIPKKYLLSDINDRLDLLRGLLDTDGWIKDTTQFYTTSKKLKDDVKFLIQSLGGIPKESTRKTTHKDCYILTFSLNTFNPFYLNRKAKMWNPNPRGNGRWIDKIEYVGKQKTICIAVDSPDESYITEDFIVTHNTPIQLEWAKCIPGDVLICAPLAVSKQTIREGVKFGIEVKYSRGEKSNCKITITNYEMLHKFNPENYNGIVLDESSILKSFSGVYRKKIIEFGQRIPFRLACTATPAPNDMIELSNHAEFLNVMSGKEMLALFFIQDGNTTHKWKIKGHAENDFWKWMASWSIALRSPKDVGFIDNRFDLPEVKYYQHIVNHRGDPEYTLFHMEAITMAERRESRKKSINERTGKAAEIINDSDEQWLVWCNLNAESELATKLINNAVEIRGSNSIEHKESAMLNFSDRKIKCLVTKPRIAGFGMNWQNCHNVVFLGLSDSYEQFYQAIRRCWRFGQKKEVSVHIIISETEGRVLDNIKRKESDAMKIYDNIVTHMKGLQMDAQKREKIKYKIKDVEGEGWKMMLGDSCERIKEIDTDLIGLSVFSPPFPGMYAYTNSERDIGNVKDIMELLNHFEFMIDELYRITIPGRSCCIHLAQMPIFKKDVGYAGLNDFRGRLIDLMQNHKWIFASERTIDKDPQLKAARTKDTGLAMKTAAKDSSQLTGTMPDYLLQFKKHGENPKPIKALINHQDPNKRNADGWITREDWIQWASAVWYGAHRIGKGGISEQDVLSARPAKDAKDEKHLCPLQLGVIERCIKLWSAPMDIIFSPFVGIGSEGYQAIKFGRRFIGIELKEVYFDTACRNLKAAEMFNGDLFKNGNKE